MLTPISSYPARNEYMENTVDLSKETVHHLCKRYTNSFDFLPSEHGISEHKIWRQNDTIVRQLTRTLDRLENTALISNWYTSLDTGSWSPPQFSYPVFKSTKQLVSK